MCDHKKVTVYCRLASRATRDQPAEWVDDSAKCNDCGEPLDPGALPKGAYIEVETVEKMFRGMPHEYYD